MSRLSDAHLITVISLAGGNYSVISDIGERERERERERTTCARPARGQISLRARSRRGRECGHTGPIINLTTSYAPTCRYWIEGNGDAWSPAARNWTTDQWPTTDWRQPVDTSKAADVRRFATCYTVSLPKQPTSVYCRLKCSNRFSWFLA